MACMSCGKRGKLIGAGVKAIVQGRPGALKPIVRSLGRTVLYDARTAAKPINPRLGRKP